MYLHVWVNHCMTGVPTCHIKYPHMTHQVSPYDIKYPHLTYQEPHMTSSIST